MKRHKKLYSLPMLVIAFMLVYCCTALASGVGMGNDATVDILQGERFSGAVQWVNKLGSFVDQGFMAFISFISFFIISASCARNVLAGAYCVFPKFWDKVDEAHKNGQDISISSIQGYFSGGGWKGTSTGSVAQFILRCLPNIKVLTDFENAQDPDYKQYFMRAIPQCVVAVFVGVFIYNGYYRDVMIVTSQFGSRVTMNALTSIKPDDILYKLSNISGIPDYPIKGAERGTDKIANTYLQAVAGHIGSEYTDQAAKSNKSKMYNALSDWCQKYFAGGEFSAYSDTDVWSATVSGTGITDVKPERKGQDSADGMTVNRYVVLPIGGDGGIQLNTEFHKGEVYYLYGMVTLVNKGANDSGGKIAIDDFTLTIPFPENGTSSFSTKGEGGQIASNSERITIGGNKVELDLRGLKLKSLDGLEEGKVISATNLNYASNTPSHNYPIRTVIFKLDATPTLSSASTGINIKVGGSIQEAWIKKKNTNTLPKQTKESESKEDDTSSNLDPTD